VSAIGRVALGTLAAVVASSSTLFGGSLPGFALAAQTTHFSFYSRNHEKVDAEKNEKYLGEVEQLLGQRVSGRAEYYRYGSAQELAAGTGTYGAGVTFAATGQIHSTQEFHAHEIVHLVAGQLGNPGTFFQEGLAVALGNEGRWQGKRVDDLARGTAKAASLRSLIAGFDRMDAQTAYPLAGSFVASLLRAHGAAKVAEFFRACGPDSGEREAAFARVFGQTLDQAGAAWAARL
jgi:hypothetical protein